MERQQREFLKVIKRNLIYPFLFPFIMVCLVLSPERGAAQFFPVPFSPFMGAPIGGFSPVSAFGGLAPMGLPSLPFAAAPYSMPVSAVPGLAGYSPYPAGPSLMPVSSPYGSPFGSLGSGIPVSYGQPLYNTQYTQPTYAQPYTQPMYTQPSYAQPYSQPYAQPYAQPTYAANAPYNFGTSMPAIYAVDPRYAQSVNPATSSTPYSTSIQQPVYYPQNPLYYSPQTTTTTSQPTTTSQTSTTAATTAIQDLPNLSALWQGTYTLYDPDNTTLTVLKEGQVTLGLTQNKNEYQINGYMTANNWEITDENKKGRVLATATYNGSQIDFISVIVKFYPDVPNDQEPTNDSLMYVWMFSGSIDNNNSLNGSLSISGPDDYLRAGTITLARKQQ